MPEEQDIDALRNSWKSAFDEPRPKSRPAPVKKMGFFQKVKMVLTRPGEFFENVREEGIKDALKYYAKLLIITVLLYSISSIYLVLEIRSKLQDVVSGYIPSLDFTAIAFTLCLNVLVIFFASIIFSFILAGFAHLGVKLLKGMGNFTATYKAYVYASTAVIIFSWLTILSPWLLILVLLLGLYGLYIEINGISKLHNVSKLRAFFMIILVPTILIITVLVLLIAVFGFVWMGLSHQTATAFQSTTGSLNNIFNDQKWQNACSFLEMRDCAVDQMGEITIDGIPMINNGSGDSICKNKIGTNNAQDCCKACCGENITCA